MISEELEVLRIVAQRLDNAGINYMITGSIAANFYSQPRMTRDIDIVIELPMARVDEIYNLFKGDFYIDRDSIVEAIYKIGMFNIIHNEKVIKIDFIISKGTDFDGQKFQRRISKEIEGIKLSLTSPEYLILSKLLCAKDSHSELQLIDVKNIIYFNKGELNFDYIQGWAEKLSVSRLLQECISA